MQDKSFVSKNSQVISPWGCQLNTHSTQKLISIVGRYIPIGIHGEANPTAMQHPETPISHSNVVDRYREVHAQNARIANSE